MKKSAKRFFIILIALAVIVFLVCAGLKYTSLQKKNRELEAQKEQLEEQIEEELERASELEDEEEYIKTIEYIEERARAIGYIYPDEIIFKKDE